MESRRKPAKLAVPKARGAWGCAPVETDAAVRIAKTKEQRKLAALVLAVRTRLDFFPRKPANYQPFTEGAIGSGRKYDLQCKCKTIPLKLQMVIGRGASPKCLP